jgi:hypothetical protein
MAVKVPLIGEPIGEVNPRELGMGAGSTLMRTLRDDRPGDRACPFLPSLIRKTVTPLRSR